MHCAILSAGLPDLFHACDQFYRFLSVFLFLGYIYISINLPSLLLPLFRLLPFSLLLLLPIINPGSWFLYNHYQVLSFFLSFFFFHWCMVGHSHIPHVIHIFVLYHMNPNFCSRTPDPSSKQQGEQQWSWINIPRERRQVVTPEVAASTATSAWISARTLLSPSAATSTAGHASTSGSAPNSPAPFASRLFPRQPSSPSTAVAPPRSRRRTSPTGLLPL